MLTLNCRSLLCGIARCPIKSIVQCRARCIIVKVLRKVYTTHFYYGWSFDLMAYDPGLAFDFWLVCDPHSSWMYLFSSKDMLGRNIPTLYWARQFMSPCPKCCLHLPSGCSLLAGFGSCCWQTPRQPRDVPRHVPHCAKLVHEAAHSEQVGALGFRWHHKSILRHKQRQSNHNAHVVRTPA